VIDSSIISQSGEICFYFSLMAFIIFHVTDQLLLEVTVNQLIESVPHLINEVKTLKSRIEMPEILDKEK